MPLPPAEAAFRARVRDDIDETTDREDRAAILADCLISRLIEVTLKDRRDYLASVEDGIAQAFSGPGPAKHLFAGDVRRVLATRKREVLHHAIRDELIDTGMDHPLWQTTMARISDGVDETFTPETLERFLAICERCGWQPPASLSREA